MCFMDDGRSQVPQNTLQHVNRISVGRKQKLCAWSPTTDVGRSEKRSKSASTIDRVQLRSIETKEVDLSHLNGTVCLGRSVDDDAND